MTEETGTACSRSSATPRDLIAIVRPDGTMRTLTGSVESVFGPRLAPGRGQPLLDHVHPDDGGSCGRSSTAWPRRRTGNPTNASGGCAIPTARGATWPERRPTCSTTPASRAWCSPARNVDERKAFEEQLRHRAFHDPLTGLANRALFYDRVEHALSRGDRARRRDARCSSRSRRFQGRSTTSIGHAGGDELLVEVARRVAGQRAHGRHRGAARRRRVRGPDRGMRRARRAGAGRASACSPRSREPYDAAGRTLGLSASIGMAISGHGACSVEELLRRADLAMYAAKRNGKRGLELYDRRARDRRAQRPADRGAWFAVQRRAARGDRLRAPSAPR